MMPLRCGAETSRRRAKPRSKSRAIAEAGEDAAERGRLQQHEHELECRVAALEVESRHVPQARETAGEREEVHQREEHRRQEERRVLEQHGRLPVGERERDVEAGASCARHPHLELARRRATSRRAISANVKPKPSASACAFQPSITSERSASIM